MTYPLRGDSVTIGRGPENSIQIIDSLMSRVHVRLKQTGGTWVVEDLRSRNGTLVNSQPVVSPVSLKAGDRIQIGDAVFVFESELAPATGMAQDSGASGVKLAPGDDGLAACRVLEIPTDQTQYATAAIRGEPKGAEDRLKSIYEIGQLMQSSLDVDELLDKVMETVCDVLHPTYACILLYDKERDALVPKVVHRPPDTSYDIIISGSIMQRAMDDRVAVVMEDARRDKRFGAAESIVRHHIRSAICVPLISKGDVLGALYLATSEWDREYNDNDLQWAAGIGIQTALGIDVARLHAEAVAEHTRERDLEIARSIQMNLLPKSMPEVEGFEFGGICLPARMVGGDYFDIVTLDDGKLVLIIADVSGKGVPAALLLASARAFAQVESRSVTEDNIEIVVGRLNETICKESMSNMFISMFMAHFDPGKRRLTTCNAGHLYPILRRPDGKLIQLEAGGCLLGVVPEMTFEKESVEIPPGSILVSFTDGVTDAVNPKGEDFGEKRLIEFIHAHHDLSPQDFCHQLEQEVEDFQDGAEQFDDFTALVMRAL